MSNTYNSGLVAEILQESAITTLGNKNAPLNLFSTSFSADPMKPRSSQNVPLVSAGPTVLENPASFESGDSTVGNVQVTVSHYSAPIHATSDEMQKGYRVRNLIQKAVQQLGNKLQDVAFAVIDEATYGARVVDKAAASFSADDLETIWAAAEDFGSRNLILDGAYYAKLLPNNRDDFNLAEQGAYGFDRIIHSSRWDGAEAGTRGIVADPGAIACVSGTPYLDPVVANQMEDQVQVTLENGLTVQFNTWASVAGRQVWHSLDVAFGAAAGDTSALALIGDTTTPAP